MLKLTDKRYDMQRTSLLMNADVTKAVRAQFEDTAVQILQENQDNVEEAFKYIFMLAKAHLSPQSYGTKLQNVITSFLEMNGAPDDESGDASAKIGNIEIKVSLQVTKNPQFNIVQFRPDHDISHVLMICHDIYDDEIFALLIPKSVAINVCTDMAHGKIRDKPEVEHRISFKQFGVSAKEQRVWNALSRYKMPIGDLRNKVWKKRTR